MSQTKTTESASKKLIEKISPEIAKAIRAKDVTFVGVTIVTDHKKSTTFPYFPIVDEEMNEEEKAATQEIVAKAVVLAAFEYAKTAGILKSKAIKVMEELLETEDDS